jgi:hypothetical protein
MAWLGSKAPHLPPPAPRGADDFNVSIFVRYVFELGVSSQTQRPSFGRRMKRP